MTQLRPPPPDRETPVSVPALILPRPLSDAELEAAEQRLHITWAADRQTIAARPRRSR